MGDALGNHADRGVVEAEEVRNLLQRVPVDADSLVDPLITGRLVMRPGKQLLQAGARAHQE